VGREIQRAGGARSAGGPLTEQPNTCAAH
jgi:hypothetical protein